MNRIYFSILLCISCILQVSAQDNPAYTLLDSNGDKVSYSAMIEDLSSSDMVFFGELHGNPIAHWLELEVTKSIHSLRGDSLYLGAEMFECGNQLVIDEYLQGLYPEKKLRPEMTQRWSNYERDYLPLLNFAKGQNLRFIATNIPRRYASMISKKGWEALDLISDDARAMIGPRLQELYDPTARAYAEMKDMMGEHVPPNMDFMQMSQASKDATMAHFSLQAFQKGNIMLHYHGSYHSNHDQGIIWWINKTQPGLDIKSLTTVTESDWETLSIDDRRSIADYIIIVDDDLPW